jgi:hypothetical protein
MNTYAKSGGGAIIVNQLSDKDSCPEEHRDEGPLAIPAVLYPVD